MERYNASSERSVSQIRIFYPAELLKIMVEGLPKQAKIETNYHYLTSLINDTEDVTHKETEKDTQHHEIIERQKIPSKKTEEIEINDKNI